MTFEVAEMTFAEKFGELKDAVGISFPALEERTGISVNTLKDYLYKGKIPSATNLFKLARALDVSCEVFSMCENEDDPPSKPKKKRK